MVSKYSTELVKAVQSAPVRGLGTELAALCIEANLPAAYVAQVLRISRMTLHTWFRGGEIRERKHPTIQLFMQLVKEDLADGVLPKKTLAETRAYLQQMCGEPIKPANEQANG